MKLYKIAVTAIKLLIAIAEYEVGPDQAPEFHKKRLFFTRKERLYCSERETFEKASPRTEDQSIVTRPLYKLRFN
jgi:hypothetical protein